MQNLDLAAELIQARLGRIIKRSSIYETEAWGKTDQQPFLNQALLMETTLESSLLMKKILLIEQEMGRERLEKNGPRTIDLDILFYKDRIIDLPELKVPHPALHLRRFVLVPMNEIAPDLEHPLLHRTIHELLSSCPDTLAVEKKV